MREKNDDRLFLRPDRVRQGELFIFTGGDVINKNIMQDMEHPFYSLSKNKDMSVREYVSGDNSLKILPGTMGMPTMYDKEIMIYCISKLVHLKNSGQPISRKIKLTAVDFFYFAGWGKGGADYKRLEAALLRLSGVQIVTNIRTGDKEQMDFFSLLDSGRMVRKYHLDGRLLWVQVTLSEWVFNAICADQVLSLPREYFSIEKMLVRRVYEIARKHCGRQKEWEIGLELLLKKTGSKVNLRHFRFQMEKYAREEGSLLEYHVSCDSRRDIVVFTYSKALCERITEVVTQALKGDQVWRSSFSELRNLLGFAITVEGLGFYLWKLSGDASYDVFDVSIDDNDDIVYFRALKLDSNGDDRDTGTWNGVLSTHVFEQVERMGLDVDKYELEYKWRQWVHDKGIEISDPDAHFFSFCRRYMDRVRNNRM